MAQMRGMTEVNGINEFQYCVGDKWRSAEGGKQG